MWIKVQQSERYTTGDYMSEVHYTPLDKGKSMVKYSEGIYYGWETWPTLFLGVVGIEYTDWKHFDGDIASRRYIFKYEFLSNWYWIRLDVPISVCVSNKWTQKQIIAKNCQKITKMVNVAKWEKN